MKTVRLFIRRDCVFDFWLTRSIWIDLWCVIFVSENLFKFGLFFHHIYLFIAVTVTNQAVTALKMLRENRNNFDLVISDVHMPDMDGFKLLEHVGLEMDLPVISKHKSSLLLHHIY